MKITTTLTRMAWKNQKLPVAVSGRGGLKNGSGAKPRTLYHVLETSTRF
jgi:hypothetical protein